MLKVSSFGVRKGWIMGQDQPGKSPLILVVDDDELIRSLLEVVLARCGYRVVVAHDGEKALDVVQQAQPAALICDIHMRGMNGFDVIRALQANPTTHQVPVILLTGYEDDADRAAAEAAGAVALLPKMRSWEPLIGQLEALLEANS